MKEWHVADTAPIAAIESSVVKEIQRAADIAATQLGHHEENLLAHARSHTAEEFPGEIGRVPFLIAGRGVAVEERIPDGLRKVASGQPLELDAVSRHGSSFFAQIFPFGG